MNRQDLQRLADERVRDAEALLNAGRWPAAYYLLGYAVECALKACASRQFLEHEVPEKGIIERFYTHRLETLLDISGVKDALENRAKSDPAFRFNWNTIRDWNERSRYDHLTTEAKARDLLAAVIDPTSGVLPRW